MKNFIKSKIGKAITAGISTALIWAIVTPLFDLIFRNGILEWDLYRYIFEPIIIGAAVGIAGYFIQPATKDTKK